MTRGCPQPHPKPTDGLVKLAELLENAKIGGSDLQAR